MPSGRMPNVKELDTPELNRLSGYLDAMSDFLIGVNYVTHFETKGFVLAPEDFVAQSVFKRAYPRRKQTGVRPAILRSLRADFISR